MAEDLFLQGLKNQFYTGVYQPVLQTLAHPASCPPPANEQQRVDRFVLLQRCLIADGNAAKTAQGIRPTPTLPPDLLAVRALAVYVDARARGDANASKTAVEEAATLAATHVELVNVAVCAALVLLLERRLGDAAALLERFPRDLECILLLGQTYVHLDRPDRARQLVQATKRWAEDATLAHLLEAQTNLAAVGGGQQKLLEAAYIFEELEQARAAAPTLMVGRAVANLAMLKPADARSQLADARGRFPASADVLANAAVALAHTGELAQSAAAEAQLRALQPSHVYLERLDDAAKQFDLCAQRYSAAA